MEEEGRKEESEGERQRWKQTLGKKDVKEERKRKTEGRGWKE